MASAEIAERGRAGAGATTISALLALAVFINYVDRGNLATAAPLIKDEVRLSGTQLGILLSAFFWTYTPSQILAGWLSERINAYRTLAIGLAIWSLATMASGFAMGFTALIAFRLLLGVGESAAFPCSSKLLAQSLPLERLGAANGLVMMGMAFGPSAGTLIGGLLMAKYGWRATFVVFGGLSLLWLWPWLANMRSMPKTVIMAEHEEPPRTLTLFKCRDLWGASLGHFASNYSYYFVLTWLPIYLVKERGLSLAEMATLGALIYLVHGTSSLCTGWLCDLFMRSGASANRARKSAIVASHVGMTIAMLGCAMGNAQVAIACLFVAAVSFGLNSPNIFAIAQTLAGPGAAGKWVGIQNCVGNVAGIVAPLVTGFVVERTGHFYWAFLVASGAAIAGIVFWGLVIRKVAPVDWTANEVRHGATAT